MLEIRKVICVKNTIKIEYEEDIVSDIVQIGKIYDMQRIYYTDDNSLDLWDCYIYDDNRYTWRLPLEFFELLDEYRNKKINNILDN